MVLSREQFKIKDSHLECLNELYLCVALNAQERGVSAGFKSQCDANAFTPAEHDKIHYFDVCFESIFLNFPSHPLFPFNNYSPAGSAFTCTLIFYQFVRNYIWECECGSRKRETGILRLRYGNATHIPNATMRCCFTSLIIRSSVLL